MLVSTLPDHCLFHEIRQMLVSVLPGFLKLVKIRHESLARKPARYLNKARGLARRSCVPIYHKKHLAWHIHLVL